MFSCVMRPRRGYAGPRRFVNRAAILALITLLLAASPVAAATRILAFGDSLTAGFGLPSPDLAFPAKLAARLNTEGYDVTIDNAGISGDTTAGGLARLDWALGNHPEIVLLELGANDALRGIDPKLTEANLDAMLKKLTTAHTKVLLCGMLAPGNWGTDYKKSFDAIYPRLAQRYGVSLYPFFLDGIALEQSLNQPDGLHPNEAGVAVLVARIAPYVERLLGKPAG